MAEVPETLPRAVVEAQTGIMEAVERAREEARQQGYEQGRGDVIHGVISHLREKFNFLPADPKSYGQLIDRIADELDAVHKGYNEQVEETKETYYNEGYKAGLDKGFARGAYFIDYLIADLMKEARPNHRKFLAKLRAYLRNLSDHEAFDPRMTLLDFIAACNDSNIHMLPPDSQKDR